MVHSSGPKESYEGYFLAPVKLTEVGAERKRNPLSILRSQSLHGAFGLHETDNVLFVSSRLALIAVSGQLSGW